MKINRVREIAINVFLVISVLVILLILGTTGFILGDARRSILDDVRVRTEMFAKRAGAAVFPAMDLFSLHVLVNTMVLDNTVKYAAVLDQDGLVRSHSDPDRIGDMDRSREGETARKSKQPLMQVFRGADGLNYFYFSEPVVVGDRRVATAVVAINTQTMQYRLGPTKQKLLLIFLAALAMVGLLLEMRSLMRKEQRAAAIKSAMVHAVSHEFNNALAVIDAAVFLLHESESKKDAAASRAGLYQTLDFERTSLRGFVKNVLNEARMDAGKFKIEKKPLALRELVRNSISAMEELMRKQNISLSFDLPTEPLIVEADQEALALVISNLVGNAVKYTPQNGSIRMTLGPDPKKRDHVTFTIENSGRGIAPADIDKIKTEFFRTGEGKVSAEGFGLGLKVCSDMLALHGSSLGVRSEYGKSTVFYFSLPVIAKPQPKTAAKNPGQASAAGA